MPAQDAVSPRHDGKRPIGRPSKKTPELVQKLADAIAKGLPDRFACALVNITEQTLSMWRHDPRYASFNESIKSAQAEKLLKRLDRIEAGLPGWQGAAWTLERCYARDFCRPEIQLNQNILIQNNVPTCETVRLVQVPAQDYEKLLNKLTYTLQPDGTLSRTIGTLRIVVSREQLGQQQMLTNGE